LDVFNRHAILDGSVDFIQYVGRKVLQVVRLDCLCGVRKSLDLCGLGRLRLGACIRVLRVGVLRVGIRLGGIVCIGCLGIGCLGVGRFIGDAEECLELVHEALPTGNELAELHDDGLDGLELGRRGESDQVIEPDA